MGGGSFNLGNGKSSYINICRGGMMRISESAHFAAPVVINASGGIVTVGKRFSSNSGLIISSENAISIGDDCAIGWNVSLIDGDGHKVYRDELHRSNCAKEITIGNHVWICAESTCLKGVIIPDNCVVGYNTLLKKPIQGTNNLCFEKVELSKREIFSWEV